MNLKEYLHFLTHCPSMELLWKAHCEKMAEYGFDRLIYGFTRYRTPNSLGNPEDFIILTNHSPDYTDRFLLDGLYRDAPMVHWALNNDGASSWSVILGPSGENIMTPEGRNVVAFNHQMGVLAGYTVSFKSISARSKGAIALTAKEGMSQQDADHVWAEHGDDIKLMNDVAHLKILTLPYTTAARSLTARQKEALEWVGDGKTMQDIGAIMGLTTATVEKHLRLAREVLGVETTAQAVLKAAFMNQFFVMDT